jgi:Fe2+ or Zn2+ uptake regulation protein
MPAAPLLLERLHAALAAQVRVTAPRQALLGCLAAAPERSWSAQELQAACTAARPGALSRATAYRTLELLGRLGLVEALADDPAALRYRLSALALAEVGLADPATGRTLRLAADKWLRRHVERLAQRHGLALEEFSLELRGRYKPGRGRRG